MEKARDIEERAKSIYGNSSDASIARGQYCRGARDQEKIMKSSMKQNVECLNPQISQLKMFFLSQLK